MLNDAPSVLAEWAERVNAETRRLMGVSVAPEIPERQEARAYLSGLLTDEEAAACVAADVERVRAIRERGDKYGGLDNASAYIGMMPNRQFGIGAGGATVIPVSARHCTVFRYHDADA